MAGSRKSNRGRKPILAIEPEITKMICDGIAAGLTNKVAIDGIITEPTFYDYMNKGENDVKQGIDSEYAHFFKSVKSAEKGYRLSHLNNISAAAVSTWQASAWLLERRYPDEYGRNRLEITGKDGEPVQTESAVKIYLPDNGRDKK